MTFSPLLIARYKRTSLLLLLHSKVGYSVPFHLLFTCLIALIPLLILHKNQSPARS
nr:MAG TPA: hypothetical protein [Caudoviricetes sp.]